MGNKDFIFKGQTIDETYICFFRKHWSFVLRFVLVMIIILISGIYILSKSSRIVEIIQSSREAKLMFFTIFIIGTIIIHRTFYKLLNYFVNTVIITNTRIIDHQKDIFFKDIQEAVRMEQIQDVERIADGFFPNLFNYGDIKIYLNAASAIKIFRYVPNAKFHFRCINRQIEERRKEASTQRVHQDIQNQNNTTESSKILKKNT